MSLSIVKSCIISSLPNNIHDVDNCWLDDNHTLRGPRFIT
jgi:hypothetical protein